eukprot:s3269_g4.t1
MELWCSLPGNERNGWTRRGDIRVRFPNIALKFGLEFQQPLLASKTGIQREAAPCTPDGNIVLAMCYLLLRSHIHVFGLRCHCLCRVLSVGVDPPWRDAAKDSAMAFDCIIAVSFRRLCPTNAPHVSLAMANFVPMAAACGASMLLLGKLPDATVPGQRVLFHVIQQYQTQVVAAMDYCMSGDYRVLSDLRERCTPIDAAQEQATHLRQAAATFELPNGPCSCAMLIVPSFFR